MTKTFEILGVLFVLVAGVFGAITWFASDVDLATAKEELSQKIEVVDNKVNRNDLRWQKNVVQEQVWKMDDRYGEGCQRCDAELKDKYRRLKAELKELEGELKLIPKGG